MRFNATAIVLPTPARHKPPSQKTRIHKRVALLLRAWPPNLSLMVIFSAIERPHSRHSRAPPRAHPSISRRPTTFCVESTGVHDSGQDRGAEGPRNEPGTRTANCNANPGRTMSRAPGAKLIAAGPIAGRSSSGGARRSETHRRAKPIVAKPIEPDSSQDNNPPRASPLEQA